MPTIFQVMFMDCDTFVVGDPTPLFDHPHYVESGAWFWPDVEGHFQPDVSLFREKQISEELFPLGAWWVDQGFDSGLLLVDKAKVRPQMEKLRGMLSDSGKWGGLSFGDKDLWHYAWMLSGANYTYSPFVGATGEWSGDESDSAWKMSSQVGTEAA